MIKVETPVALHTWTPSPLQHSNPCGAEIDYSTSHGYNKDITVPTGLAESSKISDKAALQPRRMMATIDINYSICL